MKSVVVTGGSGTVGRSLCTALCTAGYHVILLYNSDAASVSFCDELAAATAIKCDLSNRESVSIAVKEILALDHELYGIIHAASPKITVSKFDAKPIDAFTSHIDVGYYGIIGMLQGLLPTMVSNKQGRVIFVLSSVVREPVTGMSDYVGAKFALLGLMRSLSLEYCKHNILFNAILPGMISTGIFTNMPQKALELEQASGKNTTTKQVSDAALHYLKESTTQMGEAHSFQTRTS